VLNEETFKFMAVGLVNKARRSGISFNSYDIYWTVLTVLKVDAVCSILGTDEVPSLENVDSYMMRLHSIMTESAHEHAALAKTVREIVDCINLDG
jgi:hypothetical protein